MNTIVVQPCGGIGNRMRTISGAVDLAKQVNSKLLIIWTTDISLNAPFSSIFSPIPYKVIECSLSSCKYKFLYRYYKDILLYRIVNDSEIKNNRNNKVNVYNEYSGQNLFVISCENITLTNDYSFFSISSLLKKDVYKNIESLNIIGIHIRRTDNQMSIDCSPTNLFIEKIEEEIKKDQNVLFYLSTDDKSVEDNIKAQFGKRIIVWEKATLDRNDPRGIHDAVMDLYHLSCCKKIYGSYYSSFSDIAALWGNVEKITLTVKK